jgi:hypothetical protein
VYVFGVEASKSAHPIDTASPIQVACLTTRTIFDNAKIGSLYIVALRELLRSPTDQDVAVAKYISVIGLSERHSRILFSDENAET